MNAALKALAGLEKHPAYADGRVPTGAVADRLGCSLQKASALLRAAAKLGLCECQRSLRDPTTWQLTTAGREQARGERAAGAVAC